jgi:hypothetical protein
MIENKYQRDNFLAHFFLALREADWFVVRFRFSCCIRPKAMLNQPLPALLRLMPVVGSASLRP